MLSKGRFVLSGGDSEDAAAHKAPHAAEICKS